MEKKTKIRLNSRLLETAAFADRFGVKAYLVGGAVRDILLKKRTFDLDITVEGDPSRLVRALAERWHAGLVHHARFGTYVLTLPGGSHIDFVTARRESYPCPGQLPEVVFSGLNDDLFRRDFTVNALAAALNRKGRGEIVDLYGGLKDLQNRTLRILHRKSFRDDPTRIFRLARFAGRGFKPGRETERLAVKDRKFVACISADRLREELIAILSENDPYTALVLLKKWNVLKYVLPGVRPGAGTKAIKNIPSIPGKLGFLVSGLSEKNRQAALDSLNLTRKMKQEVLQYGKKAPERTVLTGRDLIASGYRPGPHFKKMLQTLSSRSFSSRKDALRFLFDKFPKKS